jgi:hypothetical protein
MCKDLIELFTDFLNNDYVISVLMIIAFSYGNLSTPKLPEILNNFLNNNLVKIIFFSLLLFVRFDTRPTVAIIISLIFVMIFWYVRNNYEDFNLSKYLESKDNFEYE